MDMAGLQSEDAGNQRDDGRGPLTIERCRLGSPDRCRCRTRTLDLFADLTPLGVGEGGEGSPQQGEYLDELVGIQVAHPGVDRPPERFVVD